jgi:lipopolysaccharide export system protein LptC
MASLMRGLMGLWAYVMRAAPMLLAALLAVVSYFTALKAGIRLWDNSPPGSLSTPDYFVESFSWIRVQANGKSRLELQSAQMEHIPQNDVIRLQGLTLEKKQAKAPAILARSDKATINQLTGEIWLLGKVDIRRAGDARHEVLQLQAPRALLDSDRETITAYDNAQLVRGDSRLSANEIRISQLSGEIAANRHVALSLPAR